MKKLIKKLGTKNGLIKPAAVVTESALPLSYLIPKSTFFVTEDVTGEFIMVTKEFMSSLQGALIMLMLLISIIHIYKPSKIVIITIMLGGLMLFASALFELLGMTFMLYGLGLLFNNVTFNKLITRNIKLNSAKQDMEIENIIKGGMR